MAEVLFILTTIFVAYVVFVVVECEKRKKEEAKQKKKPLPTKPATAVKVEQAVKPEAVVKAEPAAKAQVSTGTAVKPRSSSRAKPVPNTLKNPETGEVVRVPNNYRFTKRWIKEALVKEGLLDKIYKNTELDEEANAKIKDALEQMKMMDKYQE